MEPDSEQEQKEVEEETLKKDEDESSEIYPETNTTEESKTVVEHDAKQTSFKIEDEVTEDHETEPQDFLDKSSPQDENVSLEKPFGEDKHQKKTTSKMISKVNPRMPQTQFQTLKSRWMAPSKIHLQVLKKM